MLFYFASYIFSNNDLYLYREMQNATEEVSKLKEQLTHISELSCKLAVRYCEDEKTFRLEDLLATFHSFCQLVQQCRKVQPSSVVYLEVISTRLFSYRHLYQARASTSARGLDIGADMKIASLSYDRTRLNG